MTYNKVKILAEDSHTSLSKELNIFITGVQNSLDDPDSLVILSISFSPVVTIVRLPDGSEQTQGKFYGTILYSYEIEEDDD